MCREKATRPALRNFEGADRGLRRGPLPSSRPVVQGETLRRAKRREREVGTWRAHAAKLNRHLPSAASTWSFGGLLLPFGLDVRPGPVRRGITGRKGALEFVVKSSVCFGVDLGLVD
jgi:hypothetical protein